MRISSTNMTDQYLANINDIGVRQQKDTTRMYTGKNLVDLSDDPSAVMSIQYYDQNIARLTNFQDNAASAINEMVDTSATLENFSALLTQIKQTTTDSMSVDNADKLPTLGTQIKGLLHSLVDYANANFNGAYIFSGTKTTGASLTPTPPETTNLPFEIVQDAPSASNPSGLRVTFKGNMQKRDVNIAPNSTEQVNTTADSVFGPTGTEVFNEIITAYNKMMYKSDGTLRSTTSEPYSNAERNDMANSVKNLGQFVDLVDRGNAALGARQSRLQTLQDQLKEDITRTSDLRSSVQDADMGQVILNLNKDQMSMQYALQAGTRLFSKTLMDFLG